MKPLTRGQRRFLRDAAEHRNSTHVEGWARSYRPCPRIGDLKILAGLCKRGLMRVLGEDAGFVPTIWPSGGVFITDAGLAVVRELDAERVAKESQ